MYVISFYCCTIFLFTSFLLRNVWQSSLLSKICELSFLLGIIYVLILERDFSLIVFIIQQLQAASRRCVCIFLLEEHPNDEKHALDICSLSMPWFTYSNTHTHTNTHLCSHLSAVLSCSHIFCFFSISRKYQIKSPKNKHSLVVVWIWCKISTRKFLYIFFRHNFIFG